jgi:hypothetical protein
VPGAPPVPGRPALPPAPLPPTPVAPPLPLPPEPAGAPPIPAEVSPPEPVEPPAPVSIPVVLQPFTTTNAATATIEASGNNIVGETNLVWAATFETFVMRMNQQCLTDRRAAHIDARGRSHAFFVID